MTRSAIVEAGSGEIAPREHDDGQDDQNDMTTTPTAMLVSQ